MSQGSDVFDVGRQTRSQLQPIKRGAAVTEAMTSNREDSRGLSDAKNSRHDDVDDEVVLSDVHLTGAERGLLLMLLL